MLHYYINVAHIVNFHGITSSNDTVIVMEDGKSVTVEIPHAEVARQLSSCTLMQQ